MKIKGHHSLTEFMDMENTAVFKMKKIVAKKIKSGWNQHKIRKIRMSTRDLRGR